jgi:hypothetical protein
MACQFLDHSLFCHWMLVLCMFQHLEFNKSYKWYFSVYLVADYEIILYSNSVRSFSSRTTWPLASKCSALGCSPEPSCRQRLPQARQPMSPSGSDREVASPLSFALFSAHWLLFPLSFLHVSMCKVLLSAKRWASVLPQLLHFLKD